MVRSSAHYLSLPGEFFKVVPGSFPSHNQVWLNIPKLVPVHER